MPGGSARAVAPGCVADGQDASRLCRALTLPLPPTRRRPPGWWWWRLRRRRRRLRWRRLRWWRLRRWRLRRRWRRLRRRWRRLRRWRRRLRPERLGLVNSSSTRCARAPAAGARRRRRAARAARAAARAQGHAAARVVQAQAEHFEWASGRFAFGRGAAARGLGELTTLRRGTGRPARPSAPTRLEDVARALVRARAAPRLDPRLPPSTLAARAAAAPRPRRQCGARGAAARPRGPGAAGLRTPAAHRARARAPLARARATRPPRPPLHQAAARGPGARSAGLRGDRQEEEPPPPFYQHALLHGTHASARGASSSQHLHCVFAGAFRWRGARIARLHPLPRPPPAFVRVSPHVASLLQHLRGTLRTAAALDAHFDARARGGVNLPSRWRTWGCGAEGGGLRAAGCARRAARGGAGRGAGHARVRLPCAARAQVRRAAAPRSLAPYFGIRFPGAQIAHAPGPALCPSGSAAPGAPPKARTTPGGQSLAPRTMGSGTPDGSVTLEVASLEAALGRSGGGGGGGAPAAGRPQPRAPGRAIRGDDTPYGQAGGSPVKSGAAGAAAGGVGVTVHGLSFRVPAAGGRRGEEAALLSDVTACFRPNRMAALMVRGAVLRAACPGPPPPIAPRPTPSQRRPNAAAAAAAAAATPPRPPAARRARAAAARRRCWTCWQGARRRVARPATSSSRAPRPRARSCGATPATWSRSTRCCRCSAWRRC